VTAYLHEFEPEWAAWCAGDREALQRLLAAPGGVDRVIAANGDTLLHLAVRDGNLPMLEFLLALRCPRSLASFANVVARRCTPPSRAGARSW
jgi:hypothetical protein